MKSSQVNTASIKIKQQQTFKVQAPPPIRKLPGVKTYPQGQAPPEAYLQLEKVIGISSHGNSSVAVNPVTGDVAYPAGAIICVYNPKENKQTKFLYSQTLQRAYSCLAYSIDGRYLAAGEGAFRQPEITIWEIDQANGDYNKIKVLRGHKYGIESVMFSPNMLYLISLGDSNDRGLFVWDWRTELRVTSNKLGKPVNTFAFSSSSSFFVTAGYQHLKYWCFDDEGKVLKANGSVQPQESIMESKSADLTKVKVKVFVGVQCLSNGGASGKEEQVIALAVDGHLYVYDKSRKLTKWMNIKVERAMNCALGGDMLYCACTEGLVRIFNTKTLEHIMTLPKPPPLGSANLESGNKKIRIPSSKDSRFADAVAVLVDEKNARVVILYSDRMIFIWDIRQMDKISVYRTLYSHCGPIYDMIYIPNQLPTGFQNLDSVKLTEEEDSSVTKFATCSADRTVRMWNFIDPSLQINPASLGKVLVKNAYCKDMSRMIYVNQDVKELVGGIQGSLPLPWEHFKALPISLNEDGSSKQDHSAQQRDIEQLRCMRISPDGKHLVVGDATGNIRIHDIENCQNGMYEEIQSITAHDSEVVTIDFSSVQVDPSTGEKSYWLASGSRDRLTHIYECCPPPYKNVAILDDHSSTITSVRFTEEKSVNGQKKRLKLLSSGADKQIVIRNIIPAQKPSCQPAVLGQSQWTQIEGEGLEFQTTLFKKEQFKNKVFSMDVAGGGYGVTGHDKFISLYQITTPQGTGLEKLWDRKAESSKKQAVLDYLKLTFGPQSLTNSNQCGCELVMASCADRVVTLYEAATGNAVCRTTCGEVTTSMCLSTNLKHLITTSMDGIIYIWRLPETLTKALVKIRSETPAISINKLAKLGDLLGIKPQDPSSQDQQLVDRNSAAAVLNKSEEFNFGLDDEEKKKRSNSQEPQDDEDAKSESVDAQEDPVVPDHNEEPTSISQIMQQINKVAGQIEKIQPLRPRISSSTQQQPCMQTEDQNSSPGEDNQALAVPTSKKRNAWGAKSKSPNKETESPPQVQQLEGTVSPSQQVRAIQFKDNKLPRWAQSVTGDVAKSGQKTPPKEEKEEDIEEIFSNTLEKVVSEGSKSKPNGVKHGLFYGQIDEEDEDDERKSLKVGKLPTQEEEQDDIMIREQLRQKNFQQRQLLGLDDEDDEPDFLAQGRSHNVSSSRLFMRRQSDNRQSQSQLFLQRKQQQSQLLQHSQTFEGGLEVLKSAPPKQSEQPAQQRMKVEDIFDDTMPQNSAEEEKQQPLKIEDISILGRVKELDTKRDRYNQQSLVNINEMSLTSEQKPEVDNSDYQQFVDESISSESMVQITKKQQPQIEDQDAVNMVLEREIAKINGALSNIQQCLNTVAQSQSSSSQGIKIRSDINDSLGKSISLWNSVALNLGQSQVSLPINQQMNQSQVSIKEDARDLLEKYSDLLLAEVLKKLGK